MDLKDITNKKPDKETELLRMWATPKKKGDYENEDGVEIKFQGQTIKLTGFYTMKDKKTDKLVFAYKFKHKDRVILYYIEDKKKGQKVFKILKAINETISSHSNMHYELKDMTEYLKSTVIEMKMMDKEKKNG